MKRFLALILLLFTVLGALFACGKKKPADDVANDEDETVEEPVGDDIYTGEPVVYDNEDDEPQPHVPTAESTAGLVFEATADGKGYVLTGKGTCSAFNIVIDGYNDLPVTAIAPSAFKDFTSLIGVSLGGGIKSIGPDAFSGCTSLANIIFPASLTNIGEGAFRGCGALANVTFSEGIERIDAWAFSNCASLTRISLPEGLKEIGGSAFYSCEKLMSITLPDTVTKIGNSAFYNTEYYNDAKNWSKEVLLIGDCLIDVKKSVEGQYHVLPQARVIADGAFYACKGITTLSLPMDLTHIGDYAFYSCSALESVEIYDTMISIGASAFADCSAIKEVNIVKTGEWVVDENAENKGNLPMSNDEILKAIKPQA